MKSINYLFLSFLFIAISCKETSNNVSGDEKEIQNTFLKISKRSNLSHDSLQALFQTLHRLNSDKPDYKAMSDLVKGSYYWKNTQLDSAKYYFNNVKNYSSVSDSLSAYAYSGLGNIYKDVGDYTKSLGNFQQALHLYENQNNQNAMARVYKNIGALYMSWERFVESLDYYYKSEKIALQHNDSLLLADCHNNIGTVLEQQNNYDEAIEKYLSALAIYENNHVIEGLSYCYSNLAIVYKLKKEYDKSIEYNFKSLELSQKVNDKWMQSAILNNIGNLYREISQYDLAKKYAYQSLDISTAINAPEISYNTYESLMLIAFAEKDVEKALAYQNLFIKTKEKFENAEVNRQLSELNIKYETEKKEKLLATQKADLEKKNIYLFILGGIVFLILILLKNYRDKSKLKHERLLLENKLLEEQANYKIQQQRLDISRELHDRVGSQLTFITSILDSINRTATQLEEPIKAKLDSLSNFSDQSIKELRDTIWILNSKELSLEELKMKMVNFINQASESSDLIDFNFEFTIAKNQKLTTLQTVNLYRVFQEIINNSIKHSKASLVTVDIKQSQHELKMIISDNGVGFDFDSNQNKSFGLSNIGNRIEEIQGKLHVISTNGVRYEIEIIL